MALKQKYRYNGPVLIFGKVFGNWRGETFAVSPKQALSNLGYQFKKDAKVTHGRVTLQEKYLHKLDVMMS